MTPTYARALTIASCLIAQDALSADAFLKSDPVAGRRLFDEAKCNSCHDKIMKGDGNRMFTRPGRKITSAAALEKTVRSCIDRTGASLFPEDAAPIAAYLNEQFYKFK